MDNSIEYKDAPEGHPLKNPVGSFLRMVHENGGKYDSPVQKKTLLNKTDKNGVITAKRGIYQYRFVFDNIGIVRYFEGQSQRGAVKKWEREEVQSKSSDSSEGANKNVITISNTGISKSSELPEELQGLVDKANARIKALYNFSRSPDLTAKYSELTDTTKTTELRQNIYNVYKNLRILFKKINTQGQNESIKVVNNMSITPVFQRILDAEKKYLGESVINEVGSQAATIVNTPGNDPTKATIKGVNGQQVTFDKSLIKVDSATGRKTLNTDAMFNPNATPNTTSTSTSTTNTTTQQAGNQPVQPNKPNQPNQGNQQQQGNQTTAGQGNKPNTPTNQPNTQQQTKVGDQIQLVNSLDNDESVLEYIKKLAGI